MTMSRYPIFHALLWLLAAVGVSAQAQAQQPLRVAPLPVVMAGAADAERGSVLTTSVLQVSPANPVLPSATVNYLVRISNSSNGPISGATVVLTANGAVTLQNFDPALSCTGTASTVACSLSGAVPVGTNSRELTFSALMPPAASVTPPTQSFVLGASTTVGGVGLGGSTTTTVTVERDFSLSGVATPASVIVGQPFGYALTVANAGPYIDDWTGVQVTLDLPDQVRYRPEGNSGAFNCSGSTAPGSLIACSYSGAPSGGASQGFTVGAEAVTAATGAIAGIAVAAPVDPNGNNNTGSVGVSIAPAIATVSFAKTTLTPSPANPSQPVDFQLNLSAGAGNNLSLTGLTVTDTLPAGLVFASVQSGAPAWSCGGSGQTVTCQLTQPLATGTNAPALVLRTTPQAGVGGQTLTNQASVSSAQVSPVSAQSTVTFGTALDASATLTASQNPVASGSTYSYFLGISAAGAIPVESSAELNLPATVTIASIPGGSGWSCGASGLTVNCSRTAAAVTTTPVAEIRVNAPQVGSSTILTATANAALPGNFDPDPAPTSLQVTVNAVPPVIELLKTGPASVSAGSEFEYGLQVRNAGTFPISNLRVRDPLPAGVGLISVGGAGCNALGNTVDCVLSLAAGATQTITLRVSAPTSPTTITNTARAEFGDDGFVESTVQTIVTAALRPDVAVAKTVDLSQVLPGGRLTYTVTASNIGNAEAVGVELTDTLPAGVTLMSVTPGDCAVGPVVRCAIGALAPAAQQSYTIVVDVAATASGILTNVATVSAGNDDNPSNNEASVSTRVQPAATPMADLVLTALVTPGNYAGANAELQFRTTLRNLGPDSANAVVVAVQLPASGLQVLSAQFGGQTCALTGGTGTCVVGELASGTQIEGELRVRLTTALPQVAARFVANAQTADPVPLNNIAEASASQVVLPPQAADLALTVSGPTQVRLGAELQVTAAVANNGPEAANSVRITGTLPSTLRFVSVAGPYTCVAGAQELRCDLTGMLAAREQRAAVLTFAAQNTLGPVNLGLTVAGTPNDPLPANNTATYTVTIGSPDSSDAIEQILTDITDVFARDAIPTVADICANPPADLVAQCEAIIRARLNGDIAGATRGLRALFPEEVLSQALSANQLAATQFTNVDARMSELRGGGGGFSVSGLTVQVGRQAIPLSIFKGFGQSGEDEPAVGGSGDLISPWGGFVNGTISFGDQDISAQERNTVADFDSYALTAGVDYRKSARLVFGGAVGWNKFQSNLSDDGRLDTKGWTLTGYASYYPLERWYVDARASYGRLDFAMQRRILIPGVVDRLAQGQTDGDQLALAMATGYHFNRGGWSITPNASLRYADTTYEPFVETGAGANNASFSENNGTSVQLAFGVSVSRAFSLGNGVLLPQFDISLNREMRNQNLLIEAQLLGAPGNSFRVRSDDADRTFGNVGLGFVFVMANGRQAYVSYRELLGLDGLSRGSLNLGGRFEF